MEKNEPKVNDLAKRLMDEQRVTAVDLGRAIGLSSDAAYKLLKRQDWKISEMKAVGDYLDTNFFELFVARQTNEAALVAKVKVLEDELEGLKRKDEQTKHRLELLEQENKYLKEMVELAKMKLKQ
jgi:predicted transcriptional regulator